MLDLIDSLCKILGFFGNKFDQVILAVSLQDREKSSVFRVLDEIVSFLSEHQLFLDKVVRKVLSSVIELLVVTFSTF